MKHWSVVPRSYTGSEMTPQMTYVVPMTPDASVAQVVMMQNRQRLMSRAEHIDHDIDTANYMAKSAMDAASEAQYQLSQNLLSNQGVMFLVIALFIAFFIFMRTN
jgi:hypothetical protein